MRRTHYATPNDFTYWGVIIVHSILLIFIVLTATLPMIRQFLKIRGNKITHNKRKKK
jgi:hypothetical protein